MNKPLNVTGAGSFSGTVTAAGGASNNNDDANILTLNASQHARLLLDTSSTSGPVSYTHLTLPTILRV